MVCYYVIYEYLFQVNDADILPVLVNIEKFALPDEAIAEEVMG